MWNFKYLSRSFYVCIRTGSVIRLSASVFCIVCSESRARCRTNSVATSFSHGVMHYAGWVMPLNEYISRAKSPHKERTIQRTKGDSWTSGIPYCLRMTVMLRGEIVLDNTDWKTRKLKTKPIPNPVIITLFLTLTITLTLITCRYIVLTTNISLCH